MEPRRSRPYLSIQAVHGELVARLKDILSALAEKSQNHRYVCIYIYIYIYLFVCLLGGLAPSASLSPLFPDTSVIDSQPPTTQAVHYMYIYIYIYIERERDIDICVENICFNSGRQLGARLKEMAQLFILLYHNITCVCVYIYMCIYIYIYIYILIRYDMIRYDIITCRYIYVYVCICIYVYVCVHTAISYTDYYGISYHMILYYGGPHAAGAWQRWHSSLSSSLRSQ